MIVATLGDFEVAWDNGMVTVQRDVLAGLLADGPIARAGLAADCLRLQADVERRMSEVAYDSTAFDQDDRPFRVRPGSAAHARLVFEALGADVARYLAVRSLVRSRPCACGCDAPRRAGRRSARRSNRCGTSPADPSPDGVLPAAAIASVRAVFQGPIDLVVPGDRFDID